MIVKLWGVAHPHIGAKHVRIVGVSIERGWQCSIHLHRHQDNIFYVRSGYLEVIENPFSPEQKSVRLTTGDSYCVKAGVIHCFRSHTEVQAIEIYTSQNGECDADDIERFQDGRRFNVDA